MWAKDTDLRDLFRRNGGASRLTWRRLGVILEGLPGESLYKTALANSLGDETLAEMAKSPAEGHGRWSHNDLLLAYIIDMLGLIAYGLHVFEKPPQPYRRPGILPKVRRRDPAITAAIRAIALEHAQLHGYDLDDPT